MMEAVVITGAINCAKLQPNHHHQQTNTQFLQAGCPSCRPTNNVKALKGRHPISGILQNSKTSGKMSEFNVADSVSQWLGRAY